MLMNGPQPGSYIIHTLTHSYLLDSLVITFKHLLLTSIIRARFPTSHEYY